MALILNLESSTEVCSVALSSGSKLVDIEENTEGLNHSELLTVYVEKILKRNNLASKDIDAVAVSKGPGSYTGLRIGISAAKGFCYSAEIPLIAISTLDSLAGYVSKHPHEFGITIDSSTLFCPMIDAKRMEVYSAVYDYSGKMSHPISANIIKEGSFSELLNNSHIIFFGNGAAKCSKVITHPNAVFAGPEKASAKFMINIAEDLYNKKAFEDVAYFEPFYLKDFIATIPKNKIV